MLSSIRARFGLVLMALLICSGAANAQFGAGPPVEYKAIWEHSAVEPGNKARLLLEFTLPSPWHVNAHEPLEEFLIGTVLRLEDSPHYTVRQVVYPEYELFTFDFSPDQELAVYDRIFSIGVVLDIADDAPPGEHAMAGTLRYQACDDRQCAPPQNMDLEVLMQVASPDHALVAQNTEAFAGFIWEETELNAVVVPGEAPAEARPETALAEHSGDWRSLADQFAVAHREGFTNTQGFLTFIEDAEAGRGSASGNVLAGKSWWLIAGIVIFGGLLLNLTPCVLPLIPIIVGIIGAGAQAGSKARGFALGSAYGLGMSLVYGALGLVVVVGLSTAFGAINSTVWFNASIAVLFVVLALAMFDVITIDFSKYQAKFGMKNNTNGSLAVALGMGAVTALLAGACVAPAVIATIAYAQDQYAAGARLALLLPFLLGVGMALPWPFAGAGLSFMPKPGMWMVRVKQAFGVFILGFALYYGYQAASMFNDRYLVDRAAVAASYQEADEHGWVMSLEEGLAQARAENKPVLIDFWATWCKNCLVMNNTVLQEPAVLEALEGYVKIKYQAEEPGRAPYKEVWDYYDLVGLPTFIILQPQ